MKFEIKYRFSGKVLFTAEIDCDENSSLSVKLGLAVKQAVLSGANLIGANLIGADLSGADLSVADLSVANLIGANMSGANLRGADLIGADLIGADLSGAVLSGANLSGANLSGANLSGANLRGCPVKIPNIHQAIYAAASAPGCLDMNSWHHACGTTHCRAGWVIALAGEAGKALEWALGGTAEAAAIIYMASDPNLKKIPDFYTDNETALADMKRLAEAEARGSEQ